MKFDLKSKWSDYTYVAFDTETSGAFPIESEVIELGAVKWRSGQIIDRYQTLLKPTELLTPFNISIHGITNEMVNDAPKMSEKIKEFHDFIDGCVLLAHHAPFDLGFMALDFERNKIAFPETFNLCTSLLSRALLHTTNHKLQTLVKELDLTGGEAHRAADDAYACFQVFLKCVEKLDSTVSLDRLLHIQGKKLDWINYEVFTSPDSKLKTMAYKAEEKQSVDIVYEAGQTKSKPRTITPLGIVRNPDGDYIHAFCHIDKKRKRFYLDKITDFDLSLF